MPPRASPLRVRKSKGESSWFLACTWRRSPASTWRRSSSPDELRGLLGIERLEGLRLVNRYDVEGITDELFAQCVPTVFSEPQSDVATLEMPAANGAAVFAVEYLPGQFDQRADSASECIQLISQGERPEVRSAKVYMLEGALSDEDVAAIKHYVINPIEAREASLDAARDAAHGAARAAPWWRRWRASSIWTRRGSRRSSPTAAWPWTWPTSRSASSYFAEEGRNPTITEIKMIDTYWSDHCRHTTFGTVLDDVQIDDEAVQRRLREVPGACAMSSAATRSRCASWTWAPSARAG